MFAGRLTRSRLRLRAANQVKSVQIIPSFIIIRPRNASGQSLKKLQIVDGAVLHRYLRCLTVLTEAPGELSSKELISHLPELSHIVPWSGTPFAVFLLTPSLTHLLNEDQRFLHDAVSRLFPTAETIDTLAAVVDRLPKRPESLGQDVGSEGLSVLITDSDTERHSYYRPPLTGRCESTSPSLEQGKYISFSVPVPADDRLLNVSFRRFQRLEVPLANTIFQNGRCSTSLALRWSRSRHSRELCRTPSLRTESSTISLPNAPGAWRWNRHIPLISITVPRRIVAGVGNIIRQISLDPIQTQESNDRGVEGKDVPITTAIPASQELEGAVQAYFKRDGLQPHQVSIWALVIPQELSSRDWVGYHRVPGDDIIQGELRRWYQKPHKLGEPIRMKARDRLHHVLSGGGGWGEKQGLLALDPQITYEGEGGLSRFGASEKDERQAGLGEITKPGDFVQFFIYDPSLQFMPSQEVSRFPYSTIAFGSIPSSIDATPDTPLNQSVERHRKLQVIEDQFGALSENGIGHQLVDYAVSEAGGYEPQSPLSGPVAQTKVDAPFSMFYYHYRKDPDGSESPQKTGGALHPPHPRPVRSV